MNEELILKDNDDVIQGLTAQGLYYETEKQEQGFIPRAKKEDNFNLSFEDNILREKWIKEIKRDFPDVDESTIAFMVGFYLKDPKEYEQIVKDNKDKPSKYDGYLSDLTKKYGMSIEQEEQEKQNEFLNSLYNINNITIDTMDKKYIV